MHCPRHSRRPSTRPILFALLKPGALGSHRPRRPPQPDVLRPVRRRSAQRCPIRTSPTRSTRGRQDHDTDRFKRARSNINPLTPALRAPETASRTQDTCLGCPPSRNAICPFSLCGQMPTVPTTHRSHCHSLSLMSSTSRPRTHSLILTPPSGGNITASPAPPVPLKHNPELFFFATVNR